MFMQSAPLPAPRAAGDEAAEREYLSCRKVPRFVEKVPGGKIDMQDKPQAFRRRQIIVDRRFQVRATVNVLVILACFALFFGAAIAIIPNEHAFDLITGEQVRSLILGVNGIWFAALAIGMGFLVMLATHRVAGPAWVLKQAIEGFMAGDYSRRTRLREKDYLQDLAQTVGQLAEHLRAEEEAHRRLIAGIRSRLEAGEAKAALEYLEQRRSTRPRVSNPTTIPTS